MRSFIRNLIIFIIPIIFIGFPMEFLLRAIPNEYSFKENFLSNKGQNIEALILGSSHSYYGIDPSKLSIPAFNASHVSQSIDLDLILFQNYIDSMPNLRYLIVPMDYFTVFARTATGNEPWRIKNYKIYYDFDISHNFASNSEVLSLPLRKSATRLFSYYINGRSEIQCSPLGYSAGPVKLMDIEKTGRLSAVRHTKEDRGFYSSSINIISTIIKIAQKKRIKVLLLTFPAYKSYVDNLEPTQLNTTIETAQSMAKQYSNVTYINLLDDKRFSSSDYRDGDHLNHRGAKKLSTIVDSVILKLKG